MKYIFEQCHIEENLNIIEIEEENLKLIGEYVEGDGRNYVIVGIAEIEGERYRDFHIEFETVEDVLDDIVSIMSCDWEYYDFIF